MTRVIFTGLLTFVLVFFVFSETKNFDFLNFDDTDYVVKNPHVNTGLNQKNLIWAFTHTHAGHYHPLTWVSHQIDVAFFKLHSGSHHLVSVFIHSINALLIFILLFRLFDSIPLAFLFSVLFALHPQRIESVAWVAERKDVLSVFFGLMTFLTYQSYSRHKSKLAYGFTLVFFCLGLLAKPSLIILPFLLLLFDFWPLKKSFSLTQKIPLFFISFLSSLVVFLAQKEAGALQSLNALSVMDRMSNAFVGYFIYLAKTFWPKNLGIFYPLTHYSLTLTLTAIAAFLTISFFTFLQRKKAPWLFFAWAWFVISLLPVIGFVQIGWQSMADRWSYFPHVGFAIALCGFLATSLTFHRNKIYAVLTFVLILSIYKTKTELPHWKNSESIFTRTLKINPDNFLAHTNLGLALEKKGDKAQAQFHYEEAIRLHPAYVEALNNLGSLKAKEGKYTDALALFQRALDRNPQDITAKYNSALANYYLGEKTRALTGWVSILTDNPSYKPAEFSLHHMFKNDFELICTLSKENRIDENQKKNFLVILKKMGFFQNKEKIENCLK